MKPLFVSVVALLTVAVYADQSLFSPIRYSNVPMSETVTIYYDTPVYGVPLSYPVSNGIITTVSESPFISKPEISETVVSREPYVVAKPLDKPITVPPRLGPLMPLQDSPPVNVERTETVRSQNSVSDLAGIMDTSPPLAQGALEEEMINPKIIGDSPDSESEDYSAGLLAQNPTQTGAHGVTPVDPLGYGVLLTAIAITTIGLIYMVFVAYDYRQRWVHSLTTQNDRYLGGGTFDMEAEDSYAMGSVSGGSVSLSEGLGWARHSF